MKLSKDKVTYPGRKQVFRQSTDKGIYKQDILALHNERVNGRPLLIKAMDKGELIYEFASIEKIRQRCASSLKRLSTGHKRLTGAQKYPVKIGHGLKKLTKSLTGSLKGCMED